MTNTILNKENGSTIATWIAILVMIIEITSKHFGINIPHDTTVLFATGTVTFIIAIYSSYHPNTLTILGNNNPTTKTETEEETIINLDQINTTDDDTNEQ